MLLDKSVHKTAFQKDTQKRKGDFWKKLLLQSSVSVEKVSGARPGNGQPGWAGWGVPWARLVGIWNPGEVC